MTRETDIQSGLATGVGNTSPIVTKIPNFVREESCFETVFTTFDASIFEKIIADDPDFVI